MKIYRSFEEARGIRNPVVTTGSFDGVHIGHKAILNRLKKLARNYDGESVLITFEPHPRKVLYPDTTGKDLRLITSGEEKLELLKQAGLDNVIIVRFTKEFSRVTSEEFVRDFLHGVLNAKVIVAGFNHHFGFHKEGDYKHLWNWRRTYNFEAEEIPEQEVQNETVSSTKIRQAIKDGYIQRANAYLDHYYIVMGKPRYSGYENSCYPIKMYEVPVEDECKLLPAPGIYAVSAESGPVQARCMAVISVDEHDRPILLLHLIEKDYLPYDQVSVISFHKRILGAVDLADHKTSGAKFKTAKTEISDLIY